MSQLTTLFSDIADAIRAKTGSSDAIVASSFPTAIDNIPTGGGGDYDGLGFGIDVEAETTINKGDSIVARKNDQYVTPTRATTTINIQNIVALSEDHSVVITNSNGASGTSAGEGYQWTFYFQDSGGIYSDSYTVTLANYPESYNMNNIPVMNEDGTLAFVSSNQGDADPSKVLTIVFEIDKENKQVTYHYCYLPTTHLDADTSYTYETYTNVRSFPVFGQASNQGRREIGGMIGNKIYAQAQFNVFRSDNSSYITNKYTFCVLEYSNGALSVDSYVQLGSPQYTPISGTTAVNNISQIDENTVMMCTTASYNYYVYNVLKYNLTTHTMDMSASFSSNSISLTSSKNYKYWTKVTRNGANSYTVTMYELSFADLTMTQVKNVTITNISPFNSNSEVNYSRPSNDGRYVYVQVGYILDTVDSTAYGWSGTALEPILTKWFDTNKFVTKTYIQSIVPSSNAEYLISKATSTDCSTADRIYGIASTSMSVGETGQARGLFSTF